MTRRILAVRQDNNGDVTLLGPALRALARSGEVILACAPSGEGAARLLPDVADVVVTRAEWIAADPRPVDPAAIAADVERYRAVRAHEAIVFTSFHQSPLPTALLLRLAGVARIAAISVDYPGSLLDVRVRVDDDIHEVERSLALVRAAGHAPAPHDDGRLRYRDAGPRHPSARPPYVAIQPGSTAPARAWDPAKLRALAADLHARGYGVVVLGSAQEAPLCAGVAGDDALDLAGRTTYAQFVATIRDADALVVGNSSGIHIASATGTPVVSIFAPTIAPVRFAPWRVCSVVLGDHTIACAGCRARVCPLAGQPCTGAVGVADVVSALQHLGIRQRSKQEVVV